MKETFQVYLRSADAQTGSSTPHLCTFDLSAIIPNIDVDRCKVRVSYFDVAVTSTEFKTGGVSTIMIKLSSAYTKNSYESNDIGSLSNSSLIGVFSTQNVDNVTNSNVANLQFISVGNIFGGLSTINLVDQDGGSMASDLASKSWNMVLDIEVDDDCGCA
tara:strand:+ start:441 stop:920 length:480 start_codon:yes stop_codon:yes gene_type:complete